MPSFIVSGMVHGTWTEVIEAASLEEAKEKADEMVEDEGFVPAIDEVGDIDVTSVQEG